MKYRTMKRKLERKRKRNSAKSNQCNKIRRKRNALQFSPTLSESSFKPSSVPKISLSIQQEKTMKNVIDLLKKSQNENKSHSANICVVCDRFIKGIKDVQWIKTADLVKNRGKLGMENFEKKI